MKKVLFIFNLFLMMGILAACGAKKIDVMQDVSVKFDGYNGYGTIELENAYDWESEAFEAAGIEEIDSFSSLEKAFIIESAVSYEISPNENLSNGDEVTIKAIIDEDALEEYSIKLFAKEEKKFVVEGLPEIKQVDLFENIDVAFSGVAPYANAMIVNENTDHYIDNIRYTIDKENNLNIGDIIKVNVEYDKEKLAENGYIAENDTKEYEVSGVSSYARQLSDISEDAMEQLKKQTEDIIRSDVAKINNFSLLELTFLGNYFLNAKTNMRNGNNYIYYIYQIDLTGSSDVTYYYFVGYKDILITEDGECVYDFTNTDKPYGNSFFLGWNWVNGFENMDNLFNHCITKNLADYEYESTVALDEIE